MKDRLDLLPGVARGAWRRRGDPKTDAADREYRAKRPGVLSSHAYSCRFCGVQAPDAMEVHHLDGDHSHNTDLNLVAACVFCHPVNHLGNSSLRTDDAQSEAAGQFATLIHLPGLSQADLSHLMRTIGHVRVHGSESEKAEAHQLYEQIARYEQHFNAGFGSPKVVNVAQALKECSDEAYRTHVPRIFHDVRVIFRLSAVEKLARRFSKQFDALPISTWPLIFNQYHRV